MKLRQIHIFTHIHTYVYVCRYMCMYMWTLFSIINKTFLEVKITKKKVKKKKRKTNEINPLKSCHYKHKQQTVATTKLIKI